MRRQSEQQQQLVVADCKPVSQSTQVRMGEEKGKPKLIKSLFGHGGEKQVKKRERKALLL